MKTYLGDSVYFEIVDGQIILTTENGFGPTNTIYLDDFVFIALVRECYNNSYYAQALQILSKHFEQNKITEIEAVR